MDTSRRSHVDTQVAGSHVDTNYIRGIHDNIGERDRADKGLRHESLGSSCRAYRGDILAEFHRARYILSNSGAAARSDFTLSRPQRTASGISCIESPPEPPASLLL